MENITYNEFIKKYGIAINGLSQRISSVNGLRLQTKDWLKNFIKIQLISKLI